MADAKGGDEARDVDLDDAVRARRRRQSDVAACEAGGEKWRSDRAEDEQFSFISDEQRAGGAGGEPATASADGVHGGLRTKVFK